MTAVIDCIAYMLALALFSLALLCARSGPAARRLAVWLLRWTDAREAAQKARNEAWDKSGKHWRGLILSSGSGNVASEALVCACCGSEISGAYWLDADHKTICQNCYNQDCYTGLDTLRKAEVRR